MVVALVLAGCSDELAIPTEPLRMLRTDFPVAYLGEPFEAQLRPSGGLRPYRFTLQEGDLPPGLELAAGGLRGTPTTVGRFTFTISVRDGNLSQAIQPLTLDVRPLPEPVVRVDAPGTELREPVSLTLRVEDARGWRGSRVALRWDADQFELVEPPVSAQSSLALFSDSAPGVLLLELAALGEPRQGAFALARITLQPIDPPARLSLELAAATRYSGGEHLGVRREGAPPTREEPRSGAPSAPPSEAAEEPPSDPEEDAASDSSPGEASQDETGAGADDEASDEREEEQP